MRKVLPFSCDDVCIACCVSPCMRQQQWDDASVPTVVCQSLELVPNRRAKMWLKALAHRCEFDGEIGRITRHGIVTEFPVATANSLPFDITIGSDGNFWFTEANGNQIGRTTTH